MNDLCKLVDEFMKLKVWEEEKLNLVGKHIDRCKRCNKLIGQYLRRIGAIIKGEEEI